MDRERFDALARLLATKGSRRGALGTIVGVALFGQDPEEGLAKPGKGKAKGHDRGRRKGHDKGRGKGHDRGKGQGHTENDEPLNPVNEEAAAPEPEGDGPDVQAEGQSGRGKNQGKRRGKGQGNDKGKGRGKDKGRNEKSRNQRAQAEAIPTSCCGTLSCAKPTGGSNRQKCKYAGQNLSGVNAPGANMQQVDGRGTTFSTAASPSNWTGVNWYRACLQNSTWNGAILDGANFDQACLFDANLTGAKVNNSTNTDSAKFCRTTLPDGTVSDRDCNKGTNCCPACDETHPCPNGQVCCNGRCRTGNCCETGDCPDRQCQTKTCTTFNCQYTPVASGPGPLCNTTCCNGVCCAANQRCVNGQCSSCNAQTCPSGCCNAQGVCVSPPTNQQCGVPGATCAPCTGNTPLCNPATGLCVQCLNPNNCPPAPVCQDPTCVNGVCGTSNEPNGTPCTIPGNGPGVCSNGTCVQCLTPANCPAAPVCQDATCVNNICGTTNEPNGTACETGQGSGVCCGGTCEVGDECCTNAQCPPAEPICSNGQCVQCQNPANCPPAPVCQDPTCIDGVCGTTNEPNGTPCTIPGNGPGVCSNGTCVQCLTPANCPAAPVCQDATCVNNVCGTSSEPNGTTCQTGQGSGVCCSGICEVGDECCTDAQCPANEPFCSNGQCVQCQSANNCPPAPVCQDPTCVNGVCGTTNEPNNTPCMLPAGGPGVCSNGTCVQCITIANCPAPPICQDATCVNNVCGTSSEPNGTTCQTGQGSGVCCSGICEVGDECCTNAQCPPAEPICSNGQCVQCLTPADCPTTPPECFENTCVMGVCGTARLNNETDPGRCDGAEVCCNGFCVTGNAGQCPICCQTPAQCPPNNNCVGGGACDVAGINVCDDPVNQGKCCRPQ